MTDNELAQWIKDFEKEITVIEVEFNAHFTRYEIRDCFKVEFNNGQARIKFFPTKGRDLPDHIQQEILNAFYRTKPSR